jgi:hypothetical protein
MDMTADVATRAAIAVTGIAGWLLGHWSATRRHASATRQLEGDLRESAHYAADCYLRGIQVGHHLATHTDLDPEER